MEYLNFSRLTESDFDEVVLEVGGRRYTDDPTIQEMNCDYILEDTVIELKIIEEEPLEKAIKQRKLAELFRSDIKTVILNPLDLDCQDQRKYYQELAAPIKSQLKKASKQLKISAKNTDARVKIAIIMNNGLTMTTPEEFKQLAVERTKNDTSGIDILIVCGMYYYSDRIDYFTLFKFEEIQIKGEERHGLIEQLRMAWFEKVSKYMTKQIYDINIKRTKEPIQDLFFELNGIRYVKPTMPWEKPSKFYGELGRPREDSTGMEYCPHVATVLPVFNKSSYDYAKRHIRDDSILTNSLSEYIAWAKKEQANLYDPFQPIVLIEITEQELKLLKAPFCFDKIKKCIMPKFQDKVIRIAENSIELPDQPISLNYILVQVNEIGMDKANDIAFISHNNDKSFQPKQKFIIKGERMKYECALLLAAAHCLSLGADVVYYYRNDDFKWK
jgi:hypothetical protein